MVELYLHCITMYSILPITSITNEWPSLLTTWRALVGVYPCVSIQIVDVCMYLCVQYVLDTWNVSIAGSISSSISKHVCSMYCSCWRRGVRPRAACDRLLLTPALEQTAEQGECPEWERISAHRHLPQNAESVWCRTDTLSQDGNSVCMCVCGFLRMRMYKAILAFVCVCVCVRACVLVFSYLSMASSLRWS